jgi:chromate transporter
MIQPALPEMLRTALYIGTVGYGGPAILALMKKIIVNEKNWISEDEFMNALSLSQILPGAIGVTLLGYIGHKLHKPWGGVLMPLFFVLPSMLAITALSWAYFTYGNLKFVNSVFTGLGALVVALIINATFIMGKSVFPVINLKSYKGIIIAVFSFAGIIFLKLNIIYIILISGILGALFFYFSKEMENKNSGDLKTEISENSKFRMQNFLPVLALSAMLFPVFWFISGTWEIFLTFLKIGSLAFGGGFTAIPMIQQVVVDGMKWLNITDFRNGIAMGQITPGPIFITATFIGFKVKGIIGAVIATIGIFTPSIAAIIIIGRAHSKIKNLKIVRSVIKGFLSGFIGLLLAVVYQFGVNSLISWQTWMIFAVSLFYLLIWKKDVLWLIAGIIGVSLIIF